MAIKSQQRIKGFIVGKMELDTEREGPPMFTARAGQEHFKRLPDGKFEKVGADYFKLLQFGDEAVDSYAKYVPGHHFIAVFRLYIFEYKIVFAFAGKNFHKVLLHQFKY